MRQHERLDRSESFPGRPSPPFVRVGPEHDRELDRAGPHQSRGRVDVSERHIATERRQAALVPDQLAVQIACRRILDDLRLERSPPSVDRKPLLRRGPGITSFDRRDFLDNGAEPCRVVHEAGQFTRALVQRRLRGGRVGEKPHVSGPERVLFRHVEALELVVQSVEEPLSAAR